MGDRQICHSREGGKPVQKITSVQLDPRLRGDDKGMS